MAPASVSRRHQTPRTSNGQKVEAATAKASPTTAANPMWALGRLNRYGTTMATAALIRNERIRCVRRRPILRANTSCESTPATETVSPDAVDRNAAKAPAVTSAPSSTPDSPGNIRSGNSKTVASVWPVSSRSGHVAPTENTEDGGQQIERRQDGDDDQRGAPGVAAVRIGIEPDEYVGQPHRAEADRQGQRQARVQRMRSPGAQGRSQSRPLWVGRDAITGTRSPRWRVTRVPALSTCGSVSSATEPSTARPSTVPSIVSVVGRRNTNRHVGAPRSRRSTPVRPDTRYPPGRRGDARRQGGSPPVPPRR